MTTKTDKAPAETETAETVVAARGDIYAELHRLEQERGKKDKKTGPGLVAQFRRLISRSLKRVA